MVEASITLATEPGGNIKFSADWQAKANACEHSLALVVIESGVIEELPMGG
jgi:hypothetical protein